MSTAWEGPDPRATVVVATHRRPAYLGELLQRLELQSIGIRDFEVIVCDDGSGDSTWETLEAALRGPLRLCALRLDRSGGPAGARNAAARRARAPVLAFTDDDCLPTSAWLTELLAALQPGADIVQGAVAADAEELARAGPWDKTLWVSGPTPWFETANIAYTKDVFDRVGGFVEIDGVTRRPGGLAFGEDCLLGARALDEGALRTFSAEALVHHRCVPGTYADYLESRRRLVGFPGLAARSQPIRSYLLAGVFLTRRTAAFDLALVGVLAAALRRNLLWLAVLVWYGRLAWPDAAARRRPGQPSIVALAKLAYGDAVGLWWLLRGCARHRSLVL